MIVAIFFATFLLTWISETYDEDTENAKHFNIGPTFISVEGHWYFISETLDCDSRQFSRTYCSDYSVDVLIASFIYDFGALICIFVYFTSLIFPKKVSGLNF